MIEALRSWLLTILLLGVIGAVSDSLMPSGAIKQVGKLVCGLVLLCGILTPVVSVDVEEGRRWLETWLIQWEGETLNLQEEAQGISKPVIEGEYAAYIVDKAKEQGIACEVRVESRISEGEDWPMPWEVRVRGNISAEEQLWLTDVIQEGLGVPAKRQIYDVREETP